MPKLKKPELRLKFIHLASKTKKTFAVIDKGLVIKWDNK